MTPPRSLAAFLFHHSRPLVPWLVLAAMLTATVSVLEVTFSPTWDDSWIGWQLPSAKVFR